MKPLLIEMVAASKRGRWPLLSRLGFNSISPPRWRDQFASCESLSEIIKRDVVLWPLLRNNFALAAN